jgi:hypothetical protein
VTASVLDHERRGYLAFEDGRGVRDILAFEGGFLIIGGPVGDLGSFRLYYWNGIDMVPGEGGPDGRIVDRLEIPNFENTEKGFKGFKAEGLAIAGGDATNLILLVLYDGIAGGKPTMLSVPRASLTFK